jgi:type I restriction enzyme M protein
MRILLPWRAFGDLNKCLELLPKREQELVAEIEHERDLALQEIAEAYDPILAQLDQLRKELVAREACDAKAWVAAPTGDDMVLGTLLPLAQKVNATDLAAAARKVAASTLKGAVQKAKMANDERMKELRRSIKALTKLEEEAAEKQKAIQQHAERELALAKDTVEDLRRICSSPAEAGRHFAVVDRPELEINEFNLNLPRYVDTFEPEELISIDAALACVEDAETKTEIAYKALHEKIKDLPHAD